MFLRNCLVALLVIPITICPTAAARSAPTPPARTLASMMLTVEDFVAAGWSDLEQGSDWKPTPADLADRAVWPAGVGEELDEVRDALLAVGWQQAYAVSFAAPPDPTGAVPGRQAEVEVVAYADADGAHAGCALVQDAYATGPIATVAGSDAIGDESRLVRVDARDPQAGTPSQELVLGFRRGRFTARILLRDWGGEEPEVATIEELGARLLERIQDRASADGQVPDPTFDSGRASAAVTSANTPAVSS